MANKQILLTQQALDELKEEFRRLNDVERPDVIQQLALARSQGDLSENADYSAARDRQAQIESRIHELENIFQYAHVVASGETNKVAISNEVTFTRLDDNSKHTVVVVGNIGADPTANPPAVSNESPLGAALLDHGVGDVCTVDGPHTYQVRIDSFRLN